jgi:hypothetical protein
MIHLRKRFPERTHLYTNDATLNQHPSGDELENHYSAVSVTIDLRQLYIGSSMAARIRFKNSKKHLSSILKIALFTSHPAKLTFMMPDEVRIGAKEPAEL